MNCIFAHGKISPLLKPPLQIHAFAYLIRNGLPPLKKIGNLDSATEPEIN